MFGKVKCTNDSICYLQLISMNYFKCSTEIYKLFWKHTRLHESDLMEVAIPYT